MTSPGGAHVASVYADVLPDASTFGDRLRAAIERIRPAPTADVKAVPQVRDFKRDLTAALKALNLPNASVQLDPSTAGFNGRVKTALAALPAGPTYKVGLAPDTTGFNAAARAALARLPRLTQRVDLAPSVVGFNAASRTALAGLSAVSHRVTLDPSTVGFQARLRAALAALPTGSVRVTVTMPTATAAGTRIGAAAAREFIKAFNAAMRAANWGTPGPGSAAAGRAGGSAGGAYAATFRAVVVEALRSLPEPNIGVATSAAEQSIREIRASLERLGNERIGVTITAEQARAEAARIRQDLAELRRQSPLDITIDANARAAHRVLADLDQRLGNIGQDRSSAARVGAAGARNGGIYGNTFTRGVEAALRDLPTPRLSLTRLPTVDREINALHRDLDALSRRRIGVDIDAAAALAEMRRLEAEAQRLGRLSPDIHVRSNLLAVQTQLALTQRQLSQLGRSGSIRLNVDRSPLAGLQTALLGSTSRIQLLITAAQTIGPVIVPAAAAAAAAIGGIGAAAVAAVAGLGVGVLAISGVVGAVQSLSQARAEQAKTQTTLTRQDSQMASGADQVRSAIASLANTRAQAASQARQAAQSIADSERGLADAQRDYLRVQQDINRAREEAADALEDLDSAIKSNATSIKQANLDLADAEAALARVRDQPANSRARQEAQIAYERARQNLDDLTVREGRLAEEKQRANRAGIEGSQQVVAAQERIQDAQRRVQDAERAVAEARTAAAEQARQSAFSIAQAQQAVIAAQRSAATAAVSAASTAGGAMDELRAKMDALSPAGQRFARFIADLQPELLTLRRNAEQALPGLQRGIEEILPNLPKLNDFVRRMGLGLGQLGTDLGTTLNSDRVRPFFAYLDATAVPTVDSLARSFGRVGIGLGNLVVAFGPAQRQIVGGFDDMSTSFERFTAGLGSNNRFQQFLDYAITRGPIVMRTIGDIGGAIIHILEASAPAGDAVLGILSGIAHALEAIPIPVLTVLLTTMTSLRIAALLSALPLGTLATNMRNVGTGAISMRAALGGVVSFLGGPWTIAIAAATLGIGAIISKSAEKRAEIDRLKTAFNSYADALKDGATKESLANAQAILKQEAGLRGMVATMGQLNISQRTLIDGLNGDQAARKVVIDSINAQIALERAMQREARGSSDSETTASAAHKRRAEELERMRIAFAKTNTENREANELTQAYAGQAATTSGVVSTYQLKIDALQRLYGTLSDKTATAKDVSEAFRRAIDDLTASTINAIEAEERQVRANIDLTSALADTSAGFEINTDRTEKNKKKVDEFNEKVLRNRDALEAALIATREKTLADIAAGEKLEVAAAKNEERIQQLLREIPENQRNTKAVQDLVAAYGRVPSEVATGLKVTGAEAVLRQLKDLRIAQMALDLNISVQDARQKLEGGNDRAVFRASGGPVRGPGGPRDDLVHAYLPTPRGHIPYRLSDNEFIQPAASVDYYGQGFHEAIRRRAIPREALTGLGIRYRASGGPVEEWDFPVTAAGTKIPTLAEIKAKIAAKHAGDFGPGPGFPPWPSSPGASRGDSGVWRSIVALIRSTGPVSGSFGNSYRDGDPLWHGCVPMDTQIFTRRGWISYEQVEIGVDETVGYNPATGCAEWTLIVGMHHYHGAELWTITDGAGWAADVTPGHRWLTDRGMIETSRLEPDDQIQVSAQLAEDVPPDSGLADEDRGVTRIHRIAAGQAEVFCPTTTLGTWTAKQGSRVFLTGNSGRAVDWMGFNQDALANFFFGMRGRLLEFIHRTPTRDYAVTRGRDRGSFNNTLMEQHRNHIHVAMADGGLVRLPLLHRDQGGVIPPGLSIVDNGTGRNEWAFNDQQARSLVGAAMGSDRPLVNVEQMNVTDTSPRDIASELLWAMKTRG